MKENFLFVGLVADDNVLFARDAASEFNNTPRVNSNTVYSINKPFCLKLYS